jgi:hypothetical protein
MTPLARSRWFRSVSFTNPFTNSGSQQHATAQPGALIASRVKPNLRTRRIIVNAF